MTKRVGLDFVFDTYAWVEELSGGAHADEVYALHAAHDVGTSVLTLAELAHVAQRRTPKQRDEVLDAVRGTSEVLPVTPEIAVAAGLTRARLQAVRPGIGLVDCLIYETARAAGALLVTGDRHLEGLPGVRFLGAPAVVAE